MSREAGREKYNIRLKLLFMRCIRPLLWEMLQTVVKRKKLRHERNLSITEYLLHNRNKIERKVQKFDNSEKYVNILYSEDGVDVEKWGIRLTIFVLVDICMVDTNSKYYLGDVENIATHLGHQNTSEITRHIYKEYKKRLRKARSRFYKFLEDGSHLKRKIEKRAKKIEDGRTNKSDVESMMAKWEQVECSYNVDEGCKKNGLHRYLTIKLLLSETCCDVMRSVVKKRVHDKRYRSLDSFLQRHERRIMRRIGTLDTYGRPKDILYPRDGKGTQLHKWDITLLCWILLNACSLSEICTDKQPNPGAFADAIGKFRTVRNKIVHKPSLNISENDYQSFLRDIKDSIETCLVYIDDPDFSEDIDNEVEEKERAALTKDETIRRLQICQKDTAEHELQSNYLQRQCCIIRELSTIVRKFTGLTIPECSLELVFNNCSEDCEKKLSEILVDNINQLVSENGPANDDLNKALVKLIERCEQKGWKVTSAENGSVLLHIKCESFDDLTSLYETYGNKGSTLDTSELQEVVQRDCGSQVTILLVMYMKEMDKCMENIVNSLLEKIRQLSHPVASKKIRLWLESDVKYPKRLDVLDIETRDVLEEIANVLKSRYNLPSLSISTKKEDENTKENLEDQSKESKTGENAFMSYTTHPDRTGQDLMRVKNDLILSYQTSAQEDKSYSKSCPVDFYVPLDLELNDINNAEPHRLYQGYGRTIAEGQPGRKLQNYLEMFENIKFKKIMIVGQVGMGKSTLCQKIVSDWSAVHINMFTENDKNGDSSILRKFDFLFKISHVDVDETIENTVVNQLGIPESTVVECLQKYNCLIVLDGIDNWAVPGKETSRHELPKITSTHKYTLLITSRPWESWKPPERENIRTITIQGVSAANRTLMIKSTFSHLLKAQDIYSIKLHDEISSKFMNEVQENILSGLLRSPLMLKELIYFWFEDGIHLSRCKKVVKMIDSVHCHAIKQSGNAFDFKNDSACTSGILWLTEPDWFSYVEGKQYLSSLSRLAFQMFFSERIINVDSCVKNSCVIENILRPEELAHCMNIGLLTVGSSSTFNTIYFQQKTLQDFFGAQLFCTNDVDYIDHLRTLQRRTNSIERALKLQEFILFLGGMNPKAMKNVCWHVSGLVDADERFRIVRFKGDHTQCERNQHRILVKSLSDMFTDCIAESLHSSFTVYDIILRDLYIDNDSVQRVLECFPYIRTSYLKSLHIDCDCSLTSTMIGIQPIVEQTKDIVEMIRISHLDLFENVFLHINHMRLLKSLELCNLDLTPTQIEQLLGSAPNPVRVFLYNFETKSEIYALMPCEYLSNCARKNSCEGCLHHSVTEKYPELKEITLELLHNDFIRMKEILSSWKCSCTDVKHCMWHTLH